MAARKRAGLSENTRQRIKTTKIVSLLTEHVIGDRELSTTQIRAAEILLNKTLPNLQSAEIKAEVETVERVINANPMSEKEWDETYSLESTSGAAKGAH